MGLKSRNKGKSGEREVLNLLGDRLAARYSRNLNQSDLGGCDCLEMDGIALEIKRAAKPSLNTWWQQACEQAEKLGRSPVLAYRLDRQQWKFVILLSDLSPVLSMSNETATIGLEAFCQWYEAQQESIEAIAA